MEEQNFSNFFYHCKRISTNVIFEHKKSQIFFVRKFGMIDCTTYELTGHSIIVKIRPPQYKTRFHLIITNFCAAGLRPLICKIAVYIPEGKFCTFILRGVFIKSNFCCPTFDPNRL